MSKPGERGLTAAEAQSLHGDLSEHFSWNEAACNCCGRLPKELQAVRNAAAMLEKVRALFDRPISPNSWFRCASWNKKQGGVSDSQHLHGRAIDFTVGGVAPREVQRRLRAKLANRPDGFVRGLGCYANFSHVDNRPGDVAEWNG